MGPSDATRGRDRGSPTRLWAYLNDPMPTDGPSRLFDQKRVVDGTAARAGRRVERYVIDSGSKLTMDGKGARLQAMMAEPRASGCRVVLLLAGLDKLAVTPCAARAALAELLAIGLVLKDTSGELHPSAATVALAKSSVVRVRRGRSAIGSDRGGADV